MDIHPLFSQTFLPSFFSPLLFCRVFTSSQHLQSRSPKQLAISMETVGWHAERRGYEGVRCKRDAATSLEREKKKKSFLCCCCSCIYILLLSVMMELQRRRRLRWINWVLCRRARQFQDEGVQSEETRVEEKVQDPNQDELFSQLFPVE